ncbi:MAG: DUF349 domain-containing protein [Bacteroidota bacterium]
MNKKVSEEVETSPENVQQEAELREKEDTEKSQTSEVDNASTKAEANTSDNHQEKQDEVSSSSSANNNEVSAAADNQELSKDIEDTTSQEEVSETPEIEQDKSEVASSPEDSKEEEVKESSAKSTEKPETENKSKEGSEKEDEEDEDHEDEVPDLLSSIDIETASKEDLFDLLKKHSHLDHMRTLDHGLKELKPHYDTLYEKEKEEALKAFIDNGGAEADFEYKGDDTDRSFFELYDLLREKRHKFFAQLEKDKDENLKRKNEILEELRELVDGEESTASINKLKALQAEWKKIGHVPGQFVKSLWANYNALIDRYYDHRSIYFELKELDRQKNLKGKLELCERAEALDKLENIKSAITQLNELHEEFKHIGPIPREDQEPVWQRFKAASDKIYIKRKDFYQEVRKDQEQNMEVKKKLGDQLAEFTKFDSDRITEWNQKTKEILELQKKWEAVGSLPREHAKEINKNFWGHFKEFFNNKNNFFKKLEGMREENLKKKQELMEKAVALKDSDNWDETANKLKELQAEWREIGPVPEKFRNEIYKQFKAACDHFFEKKRGKNQERNQEFEVNLKKKEVVCDKLEAVLNSDTIKLDDIYDLLDEYAEIGFVPRQSIKAIHNRFDSITNQLIALEELTEEQRNELKTQVQVNKLKGSPHGGQKINRKEHAIKRKISTIEGDITTWKNNLEFFANSKTADKLKDDFNDKIKSAEKELIALKKQLEVMLNS